MRCIKWYSKFYPKKVIQIDRGKIIHRYKSRKKSCSEELSIFFIQIQPYLFYLTFFDKKWRSAIFYIKWRSVIPLI